MAAEDLIPALQTAVGSFNTAADAKKAVIDGKATSAQTALTGARTALTGAEAARDTAVRSSGAAYRDFQSAKANLDHQDLAALAASKALTAVDVFVYDTSKDSDGGAWRHRCSKLSWFNEPLNTATRGARREFPAVAVITAEGQKVTIYDGDDPDLPMWMVFSPSAAPAIPQIWRGGRNATSVSAVNGTVCFGLATDGQGGVVLMGLIADSLSRYSIDTHTGGISVAQRNDPLTTTSLSAQRIVNWSVNDVAMTVLPDAPVDPATGLPVPTLFLQTAGGLSRIASDGTVTNGSVIGWPDDGMRLGFSGDYLVSIGPSDGFYNYMRARHVSDPATTPWITWGVKNLHGAAFPGNVYKNLYAEKAFATTGALVHHAPNPVNPALGMECYVKTSHCSGWMPGDVKGAFLSDADDTDLVGGNKFANSDFSTGDNTGWTTSSSWLVGTGDGSVDFSVLGQLTLTEQNGSDRYVSQRVVGSKVGDRIKITLNITNNTSAGNARVRIGYGSSSGSTSPYINIQGTGLRTYYLTAAYDDQWLVLHVSYPNVTITLTSFEAEVVDYDRSVNNKPLDINGTITRSPVATGAELVAYSGFSTTNYLEQPYNSALDFGTGDFCVMGWVKLDTATTCILFNKSPSGANVSPYFEIQVGGGNYVWVGTAGAGAKTFGAAVVNSWKFLTYVRKDGVGYAYLDARLNESEADTSNYNHSSTDVLRFGIRTDNFGPLPGSLALWRISATAPTADQIRKIYEDEKVLFQENAACTLYGTSDAVTALAHDPDTGLLHVGTSQGRSVFKGLRRVANTTTAVGTAISAVNGMVVEE